MRSIEIWQARYANKEGSGAGSRESLLEFKAGFLNAFFEENEVRSVTDFGHGDLEVAKLLRVPRYVGVDIFDPPDPPLGLALVRSRFDEYRGLPTDVVVCLDVLYHILKGEEDYLRASLGRMVETAERFLVVYAQDSRLDHPWDGHMHNSPWLQDLLARPSLRLVHEQAEPAPGSAAKFFIFRKVPA